MGRTRERKRSRRDATDPAAAEIAKLAQPFHKVPTYDIVNEEGLDLIHAKSLEILSDIGIDYYDAEAQAVLKAHGVKMVGDTAYFDREMIAEYVAKAPSQFTQLARNPDNNVIIGGNYQCFAPVYGLSSSMIWIAVGGRQRLPTFATLSSWPTCPPTCTIRAAPLWNQRMNRHTRATWIWSIATSNTATRRLWGR